MLLFMLPETASSQNTPPDSTDKRPVVRSLRFIGNNAIDNYTLESLVRTRTNREFLGIPSFTPRYFIWRMNIKIGQRLGEPPVYLDRNILAKDISRIKTYYESIGFQGTEVDTSVFEYKENKVEVTFMIDEGPAAHLKTISYTGMPDISDDKINEFFKDNPIIEKRINDSTFRVNKRFQYDYLTNERNRIISFLKDNGYAAVQRDSIQAQVKKEDENPYNQHVLFIINSGNVYTFGDVYIRLSSSERQGVYDQADTVRVTHESDSTLYHIYLEKDSRSFTNFNLLTEQLLFSPGMQFNQNRYMRTMNEFQNLNMMSVNRFGLSQDGSLPDYSNQSLPVLYDLQTVPRQRIRSEFFGMQRYGFGAGSGITYTNNNLFGNAENLDIGVNWNFEYVGEEALTSANEPQILQSLETHVDYSVPRLNFPFSDLDQNLLFSNARTNYRLSYRQSNQLNFDINAEIRFNLQYQVNHSQHNSSFLDLIELDWLDARMTEEFEDILEQQFDDPNSLERLRIEEEFRSQFSSIVRYTFRSNNTDIVKRNKGHYSEVSFAVGGNIPYLVDRFIVTPNTLESNLPSFFDLSGNRLSYTQFVKLTGDYRRYISLADNTIFAFRFYGGIAHPYGKNKTIPLTHKFFAGGSYDIRGWPPYNLGPGAIPQGQTAVNGGEIKLSAFTELRQLMIRNLLAANWHVVWFNDMGNVWYGPANDFSSSSSTNILDQGKFYFDSFYKQIALSSGIGLRLDWEYVVVRFDWAWRIHNNQNIWIDQFELNDFIFTFGIGHSF